MAFGRVLISALIKDIFLFKNILRIEKNNKNILLITIAISFRYKLQVINKLYRKHNPDEITSKQVFWIMLYNSNSFLFLFILIEANIKNRKRFLYLSSQKIN